VREPFPKATASLRFDGTGVRIDGVTVDKAARSPAPRSWAGTRPTRSTDGGDSVEEISGSVIRAPLTGIAEFRRPAAPRSSTAQRL
jgi:hypothetical protein